MQTNKHKKTPKYIRVYTRIFCVALRSDSRAAGRDESITEWVSDQIRGDFHVVPLRSPWPKIIVKPGREHMRAIILYTLYKYTHTHTQTAAIKPVRRYRKINQKTDARTHARKHTDRKCQIICTVRARTADRTKKCRDIILYTLARCTNIQDCITNWKHKTRTEHSAVVR